MNLPFHLPMSRVGRASIFSLILVFAAMARALGVPAIPNPSFEQNSFTNPANASIASNVAINGWTTNDTANVGQNPSGGVSEEADNGTVPNGTRVVWIRSAASVTTTFSTTISGLVVGRHYRVQFRANQRTGAAPSPSISLNGGARVRFTASPAVGGTNPYRTVHAIFVATATTAALEISNSTASASTLLVDHFAISAATPIQVTNANDSGAGSLRAALAAAAGTAAFNVITFAAALSGQTITLSSELAVNDIGGVAIDASALVGGLTIHGGTSDNRIFNVGNDAICSLRRLTLTSGDVQDGESGGAIQNAGALAILQCTLTGNTAGENGGAIANIGRGELELTRCTLVGNSVTENNSEGGAIHNLFTLALTHCTLSGNTSKGAGNAISNFRRMTAAFCIIANNDGGAAEEIQNEGASAVLTLVGANVIQGLVDSDGASSPGPDPITNDPLLSELASNGGPTQTMAIAKDSPARNAAAGSTSTTDQRGLPIIAAPDIGAFEMQAGTFVLSAPAFKVLEGSELAFNVNRTGAFSGPVTVRVTIAAGTATSPADFAGQPNTINHTIPDGDSAASFSVPTSADFLAEGNQTFTLTLSIPTATPGASLGSPTTATVTIVDPIQVTNVNDAGSGSLRQAFVAAAANSGPDAIHFSPALNGRTITLGSEILVNDSGDLTVDASNLASGLTIDGGPGTNRILSKGPTEASLTLRRLTLTGGNGAGAGFNGFGGAILDLGVGLLALTECTLVGNTASRGGAIDTGAGGGHGLHLTQCTLSGNTAISSGGAISCGLLLSLTHCTISANTVTGGSQGGGGVSTNVTFLTHNIVAGNSAPANPNGADVSAFGTVRLTGTNIIQFLDNSFPNDTSNGSISTADPLLGPLANNGGPTKTHALLPGSPAINSANDSSNTSDQRGFPIAFIPDIGAFEAQLGGTFSLDQVGYSIAETGGFVKIRVLRTGSFLGEATVRLTTSPGSASAADFTGKPNNTDSDVTFQPNEFDKTVTIDINGDSVPEPNETFTVTLSRPSPGCNIGTPASALVVIRDPANDVPIAAGSFPTTTITFPPANALLNVPVGGTITVTGTASDNKGVTFVSLEDAASANAGGATLSAFSAANTAWSFTMTPVAGLNTVFATATDTQLNTNPVSVARTFQVRRPLEVNISGVGSVTQGFSPSSFREVGRPFTITATAGTGALFDDWKVLSSHTPEQLGISTLALEKPTLTFVHREGLAIRATFVPNPFGPAIVGTYNGGITHSTTQPAGGTPPRLDTEGYISVLVQRTGAFSGSLKIDGTTLPVAGAFDHVGVARFGTSRAKTLNVARPGKTSLAVFLRIDLSASPFTRAITGTVSHFDAATLAVTAVSNANADRAFFSATNPVPPTAFGATVQRPATGIYSTIFVPPLNEFGNPRVPQGWGRATVTLGANGVLTVAGALADGTPLAMSTTISQSGRWRLFSQLYPGLQGFIAGDIFINHAGASGDLLAPASGIWVRPVLDRQHYPLGWQDGLIGNILGTKHAVPDNASLLPLSEPTGTGAGNATLTLSDLLSPPDLIKQVDISSSDAVTEVPADAAYSLSINRATGVFSGTFTHPDGTLVPYSGVIFTKGSNGSGFGFYLTTTPAVKDYTGQVGGVRVVPRL
jgi:hypothetical protein